MEAKDLMIGDWVQYRDEFNEVTGPYEVDLISNDEIAFKGERFARVFNNSNEPIPLIKEILEKNGFVHKDKLHDEFSYEVKGRSVTLDFDMTNDEKNAKLKIWLCISTSNPNDSLMPHRYFEGYIEYVHELQHALRLCNVDLQIELWK